MKVIIFLVGALALVNAQECGVKPDQLPWEETRDFFVVGGRDAEVGAWPWQMSLQYFNEESNVWSHTCGAVHLGNGWALSAAHCVFGRDVVENFRLMVGGHELNDTENNVYAYLENIFIHENYTQNPFAGYPNDICLLKMDVISETEPACLPDADFGDFAGNTECWISGWGLDDWLGDEVPNTLQEGKVPVPTNEECESSNPAYELVLRDFHLCVGDGSPSACRGDSGGPVTCLIEDTWYVAGVASFGPVFCSIWPMVYTRTSFHADWIADTMANN